MKTAKKILKVIGIIILLLVLVVAGVLLFLSITEYKPADVTDLTVTGTAAEEAPQIGETYRVMTWNIGYGALGDNADFFMDGGKGVKTADRARVEQNLSGVIAQIEQEDADFIFLQEADQDSARSSHINEVERLEEAFANMQGVFANNFKVAFIPYPIPPIGKVDSGILTLSDMPITSSQRVQLPIPFSWPIRMGNLKRCLTLSRVPIADSQQELILIDLHLEAYDDGEGKAAQTEMLRDILDEERAKGNYVIAGGDFNQVFSNVDTSAYPTYEGKWQCGEIDVSSFSEGWQFLMDPSAPSCRSLDQPYVGADKEHFQYYMIDGFIVSDNIEVQQCRTRQLDFVCSDHNPVVMDFALK